MTGNEFKSHISTHFNRMKCKKPHEPLVCLPVYDNTGQLEAYLKPIIQDFRRTDPELAELMGKWRQENPTISTGTFEITTERTLRWLDSHIIAREDRLLFLLVSLNGKKIGHLGYSNLDPDRNSLEIDSILKGEKEGYPGIMTRALNALIHWGYHAVGISNIRLSVYSDNEQAIRFYKRLGFSESERKPLVLVEYPDEKKWELAPEGFEGTPEKYYLYMDYDATHLGDNRRRM